MSTSAVDDGRRGLTSLVRTAMSSPHSGVKQRLKSSIALSDALISRPWPSEQPEQAEEYRLNAGRAPQAYFLGMATTLVSDAIEVVVE